MIGVPKLGREVAQQARARAVVAGDGLRAVGAHQPRRALESSTRMKPAARSPSTLPAPVSVTASVARDLAGPVDGEHGLHRVDEAAEAGDLRLGSTMRIARIGMPYSRTAAIVRRAAP